jgi:large exoprotein involved in heme utilization and adhesion
MAYIGSAPRATNTRTIIDHKFYTGSQADSSTNSGYYTFYVNYTVGQITVLVRGIAMDHNDFVATNGTDVRISTSLITLANEDTIELIGHIVPSANVLERSDVNITGGRITGVQSTDSRLFMNDNEYTDDLTIASGKNAFFCGPVNFTGTLDIQGVLNIV